MKSWGLTACKELIKVYNAQPESLNVSRIETPSRDWLLPDKSDGASNLRAAACSSCCPSGGSGYDVRIAASHFDVLDRLELIGGRQAA